MKEEEVIWPDYTRVEPGIYRAYCKFAKWYRDPQFKRWTCLLQFDLLTENLDVSLGIVPIWFNGGNGQKPRAELRSNYLPAWVKANGGPPARKDRLSPKVFLRRMARVRVDDTDGPVPYSVVREILEWATGIK
jgi:hypothetical protein